jgi:nicotinamide-nucleotide amidase
MIALFFLIAPHGLQTSLYFNTTADMVMQNAFIGEKFWSVTVLHLFGLDPESALSLTSAHQADVEIQAGRHAGGWTTLQATGLEQAAFYEAVAALFPRAFIADDPFVYAIEWLQSRRRCISLAESCTGGRLAAAFTAISGVSEVFEGSFVTYSNRLKTAWLGVDPQTLEQHGAVSEAVVEQMVAGTLKASRADYALAISGIAGPGGGTPAKPVGTVFVASGSLTEGLFAEQLQLHGDRAAIQHQAACHALRLLFENHFL